MHIYVCRHGETVYNAEGLLQGWFDTPLTDSGEQSARELAQKLKSFSIATIVSSDLGRAFMTAYIISRGLGYTGEIVRSRELREVSFGDLAGLPEEEISKFYHHLRNALTYTPPNGETLQSMQRRVLEYLRHLSSNNPADPVLLVTHDCVMNALYAAFNGTDFGKYNIDHTNAHDAVMRLEVDGEGRITNLETL